MNPGLTYREVAVGGASPVRLVILLYDQAIADLRRALEAQARGDIAGRTREINHTLTVVGHLRSTLDPEQGGTVAANLDRFYEQLRIGLVEAQCQQSALAIERQLSYLLEVHDAWCEVERAVSPPQTAPPAQRQGANQSGSEWNA